MRGPQCSYFVDEVFVVGFRCRSLDENRELLIWGFPILWEVRWVPFLRRRFGWIGHAMPWECWSKSWVKVVSFFAIFFLYLTNPSFSSPVWYLLKRGSLYFVVNLVYSKSNHPRPPLEFLLISWKTFTLVCEHCRSSIQKKTTILYLNSLYWRENY